MRPRAIDGVGRYLEIGLLGRIDIDEGLRVAVDDGKPSALNLHHDAVPPFERVVPVAQVELDGGHLARNQRLRAREAVPELRTQDFPGEQHLKMSHANARGIGVVVGVLAGVEEGIELNILGLVFGIDPLGPAIKLPGIGRIGFGGPRV